ncbi:hypothetical protein SLEP1_g1542 [Rubroshorea leprosula]|uniref:PGG domain-containing protein n=1 Tax=Rubroshorea leprosula TaxID=152421 RepID=A0AAV5HL88_9ROSI|nr:hypothetical protein SLEP1_g1542 [Rubroshorea leprosula]
MDERMRAVAERGDIDALYALIQENSYVLEDIDKFPFIDTPLHIAAFKGHIDFAMEMMNLKPSYARKLNPAGLSPMHLALLNCQIHMVRSLLECKMISKNKVNLNGQSALDMLSGQVNNSETVDILRQAGCLEAKSFPEQARQKLAESLKKKMSWLQKLRRTMTRQNNMISSDMRNAMLVVAVLILTATYQTCLTPPGGVWQGNLGDNDSGGPMRNGLDFSLSSGPVFPNLSNSTVRCNPHGHSTLRGRSTSLRYDCFPESEQPSDATNATESKVGLSVMSTPSFIYFYVINTATFLITTAVVFLLLPDNTINLRLTLPVMLFILCYMVSMMYLAPFPILNSTQLQPYAPIIMATVLFLIVCLPKFFNLNLQS